MVVLRFNRRDPLDRHPFDALYLERLRAGDADTERHFYAYFNDLIRLKVRARGLAASLDDIRQETLLRVVRTVRSANGLRNPGALGAFVNSVCGNVILETGRTLKTSGAEPPDEDADAADAGPNAEAQFLREERKVAVRGVIDSLEPRDRDLLAAIFLEEEDRDRVCQRMGVSRDYLRVLVHRAKLAFTASYVARTAHAAVAPDASVSRREGRHR